MVQNNRFLKAVFANKESLHFLKMLFKKYFNYTTNLIVIYLRYYKFLY